MDCTGVGPKRVDPHISARDLTTITLTEDPMGNLLPGGYTFTHLVFWTVVGMVVVGTNAVAIILVIGLSMMALETVRRS